MSSLQVGGFFFQTVFSQRNVKTKKKNIKISKANKYACSHVPFIRDVLVSWDFSFNFFGALTYFV